MSTTEIGKRAEQLVVKELKRRGYKILGQNWRTRWCEIDIVALKLKTAFLVEVKYRKNSTWGDGLEAITSKKLQQMSFAAEIWVNKNSWADDYQLMVASVSGNPPSIDEVLQLD